MEGRDTEVASPVSPECPLGALTEGTGWGTGCRRGRPCDHGGRDWGEGPPPPELEEAEWGGGSLPGHLWLEPEWELGRR